MANPIDRAVRQFSRLPGVGRRTGQRYVYHLLRQEPEQAKALIDAITSLITDLRPCKICNRLSEREICDICSDPRRDEQTICVVGETSDLDVIDQSGKYRGRYHVLGGLLNPTGGIGPEQLNITSLVKRVDDGAHEVILALNANVEGETTALYLARLLKSTGVRVTGLARGLPAGGSLDHADKVTVGLSLDGRIEM